MPLANQSDQILPVPNEEPYVLESIPFARVRGQLAVPPPSPETGSGITRRADFGSDGCLLSNREETTIAVTLSHAVVSPSVLASQGDAAIHGPTAKAMNSTRHTTHFTGGLPLHFSILVRRLAVQADVHSRFLFFLADTNARHGVDEHEHDVSEDEAVRADCEDGHEFLDEKLFAPLSVE